MNYSDTERVEAVLEKLGYEKTQKPSQSDLYIFNTCSIRQKGEDRVYGQLKKLISWKNINPRLLCGLTGCMVRKTSTRNSEKTDRDEMLKKLDSVDFVFNIKDTHLLGEVLAEAEPKLLLPELEESQLKDYLRIDPNYTSKLTAYVPIQTGCDQYCTYCIVPYARGREESRPMKDILEECERLVKNGCREITLGGQIVNSYGQSALDKLNPEFQGVDEPFVKLLTEVDRLHELGLNRLRFTSPHPRYFSDALIEAHAKLKTLCPHIHLPIQSGDDDILKKMNRRYTIEDYRQIVRKIREAVPGCAIGTDIIVGFCGETDEQFENTYRLYEEIRWDMSFMGRYSPRQGTVSIKAFEDDVPRQVKAERWHRLNGILEKSSLEGNLVHVGKHLEVLVEKFDEETMECEGRSRENKVVQFPGSIDFVGKIMPVKITEALQWVLKGKS